MDREKIIKRIEDENLEHVAEWIYVLLQQVEMGQGLLDIGKKCLEDSDEKIKELENKIITNDNYILERQDTIRILTQRTGEHIKKIKELEQDFKDAEELRVQCSEDYMNAMDKIKELEEDKTKLKTGLHILHVMKNEENIDLEPGDEWNIQIALELIDG